MATALNCLFSGLAAFLYVRTVRLCRHGSVQKISGLLTCKPRVGDAISVKTLVQRSPRLPKLLHRPCSKPIRYSCMHTWLQAADWCSFDDLLIKRLPRTKWNQVLLSTYSCHNPPVAIAKLHLIKNWRVHTMQKYHCGSLQQLCQFLGPVEAKLHSSGCQISPLNCPPLSHPGLILPVKWDPLRY